MSLNMVSTLRIEQVSILLINGIIEIEYEIFDNEWNDYWTRGLMQIE